MTDIERARAKRDLRDGLARSIKLSAEPCPNCEVAWNLHTVERVVACCEALVLPKESA